MQDKSQSNNKGERIMTQGFIAQYAAEASLGVEGVASLEKSVVASIKEAFGVWHEGQGVEVIFDQKNNNFVNINVYPNIYFGYNVPEIAWKIQSNVKTDVEKYTGLEVDSVNVYVKDIIEYKEAETEVAKSEVQEGENNE